MRLAFIAPLVAPLAVVAASCDVLVPPPPAEPPPPGWHLSVPVADVRSINDVIVIEPFDAAAEDFPAYHGYAVGNDGIILRVDRAQDGTVRWSPEASGVDVDLESIDAVRFGDNEELVVAVGANGTAVQRSADGTWSVVSTGTTDILFDVTLRNQQDGFAVGDNGTVLRFTGGGFVPQVQQLLQEAVGGACPDTGDCGVGSQCIAGVCHSFFPIPEPLKGVGDAGGLMIAVGARGAVYRYDANGEPTGASNRWLREDAGTQRTLAGIDTESGITVPTIEGVLMRRNGDDDWDDDSVRVPSPVFLQDVWTRGNLTAVGLSEDIYQLNDEGLWQLTRVADGAELRGVDGVRFDLEPGAPGNEDGEEVLRVQEIFVVGGGGRVVRGPLVLPGNGEIFLETRLSDDDFIE